MITYRKIESVDNVAIAKVIRTALEEYGVNKPGTVYTDPTTDDLYALFQTPKSCYWIALDGTTIIGGCGIFPTQGLPVGYAELVKLYLSNQYRGKGVGKALMEKSKESARQMGYTNLYLESLPELNAAVDLYYKVGFSKLNAPLGNSGHFACNLWMECQL